MRLFMHFAVCAVLGILGSRVDAAPAADDSAIDVKRLARDQDAIRERLSKMQEKMTKLAAVLRDQGKEHSAKLLDTAVAEIATSDIRSDIERISASLSREEFGSVKQQEELLTRLESIYSILLDRASLEQIEQDMKKLEEALRSIGELKDAQKQLREETSAATANRDELLKKARELLDELRARQDALAKETAAATESKDARLAKLGAAVDSLLERQTEENEGVEREIERLASGLRIAETALVAQESATERLEEAMGSDASESTPSKSALADALKKLAESHAAAKHAFEQTDPRESGSGEAASDERRALEAALENASRAAESSRTALENGDVAAAAKSARAATEELAAAKDALGKRLESAPAQAEAARRQSALAEDIAELAREARSIDAAPASAEAANADRERAAGERAKRAAEALDAAAREAAEASEALTRPDLESAAENQTDALEALANAKERIEEARAGDRENREDLAEKQDYAASQAAQLKETLSRADQAGREQEVAPSKATEGSEAASQSMAEAAKALRESSRASAESPATESSSGATPEANESASSQTSSEQSSPSQPAPSSPRSAAESEARSAQSEASKQLDEVSSELERMQAQAAAEAKPPEAASDAASRYEDLESKQKEIEDRTRDLMKRIEDEKKPERDRALDDAASKMQQAANELKRREGEDAIERQKEAEKYLNKAEQDLKEEQERYQNLRQEELLFKVREQLTTLRGGAAELLAKTEELHLEKVNKGKLSRLAQTNAKKYAQKSRDMKVVNAEVIEKLREDGAVVFTFALESNALDFDRIAELLGTSPHRTDDFTQSIERDVLDRYDTLLATLDEELDRRKQAKVEPQEEPQGEEGQQPQEGKQPLIPPVAELLLVKRMEEQAMKRLDVFLRTHPELGTEELNVIARDRLTHLGLQHSRITKLFESLVDGPTEAPVDVEDPEGSGN